MCGLAKFRYFERSEFGLFREVENEKKNSYGSYITFSVKILMKKSHFLEGKCHSYIHMVLT